MSHISDDLAHDPLLAALRDAQTRHQLLPLTPAGRITVVVAVSGGADSVCLLHALHALAPAWRLDLHVAHVDHRLRPEAAADAAFVAALASQFGLPCVMTNLDPQWLNQQAGGLEAAARDARYGWLGAVARAVTPPGQPPIVAVGHHAGDQAETVLLHLLQGAGVQGLGGMAWVSPLPVATGSQEPVVRLVRPLLEVQRAEIEAYLHRHALTWRTDATNEQLTFLRNRIRHEVLPLLATLNPQVTAALGRTAALMTDAAARLRELDQAQLAALCTEPPAAERVVLDWTAWACMSLAARRALLHAALAHLAVDQRGLNFAVVDEVARRAAESAHATGPHPLAGGAAWTIAGATGDQLARLSLHRVDALSFAPRQPYLDGAWRAAYGSLLLSVPGICPVGAWRLQVEELASRDLPADWQHNTDPWRAYLDAAAVEQPILTAPQPGQQIAPLGMEGRQKALGDLFTDRKLPRALRTGWPLIVDQLSGRVLWVCGLHVAHTARITPETTRVLALKWESAAGFVKP